RREIRRLDPEWQHEFESLRLMKRRRVEAADLAAPEIGREHTVRSHCDSAWAVNRARSENTAAVGIDADDPANTAPSLPRTAAVAGQDPEQTARRKQLEGGAAETDRRHLSFFLCRR